MKRKILVLIVLVVAIVGIDLWRFMQPELATSSKTADVVAPAPSNVNVTKPVQATSGISAPTAKPVQPPPTIVTTPAQNDTQAMRVQLNVIIDDMAGRRNLARLNLSTLIFRRPRNQAASKKRLPANSNLVSHQRIAGFQAGKAVKIPVVSPELANAMMEAEGGDSCVVS